MLKFILRTITAVLMCCLFCFAARALESGEDALYEKHFADADGDGSVTSADARLVLRCAVGLELTDDYIKIYGDADRSGMLDADDARIVLRISVGLDSVRCALYGHSVSAVVVAPTCISEGFTEDRCSGCSYTEGVQRDIVPSAGHTPEVRETSADCTSDGLYICVCTLCGTELERRVTEEKKGHSFGVWHINSGVKQRICRQCSFTETSDKTKTVYLTFDDGPGAYTERLLGYLARYGVKATFFVTDQFSRYSSILTSIARDGHTIGVHSLTHQWTIYSGKQSYLNDFNAMHKLILDKTGIDTRIFRFPGGTNNTVSRSYSRGIMSELARTMTQNGYVYYDWNVDCCDTLGYSSQKIASTTIAQIKNKDFSIVLMHDIKSTTVEAVCTIIEYCIANGYELAAIDESTPVIQFSPVN